MPTICTRALHSSMLLNAAENCVFVLIRRGSYKRVKSAHLLRF